MPDPSERLPLNALRVFEAVATHLSFTAAAKELGVTTAAVSAQVKAKPTSAWRCSGATPAPWP
jgi:LysR family glycine cleavage system transcriptional activator